MTKKITQKEFIEGLMTAAGCKSDEAFGLIFGVSKSAVGLWKNGRSPVPLEKFLATFGKETLDWIRQEYNLDYNPEDMDYAEAGRMIGAGIQKLIEIRRESVVKAETFSAQNDSSSAQLSSAHALPKAESSLKRRNPDGQYDDQGIDDDFTVYESGPEFSPEEMKVLDDFARQTVSHQDLP